MDSIPDDHRDYAVYFTQLVIAFCERRIDGFTITMPKIGLATVEVVYDGDSRPFTCNTMAEAIRIALSAIPKYKEH